MPTDTTRRITITSDSGEILDRLAVDVGSTDTAGNPWGVHGLMLCSRCCRQLHKLDDAAAFWVVTGTLLPSGWVRRSSPTSIAAGSRSILSVR